MGSNDLRRLATNTGIVQTFPSEKFEQGFNTFAGLFMLLGFIFCFLLIFFSSPAIGVLNVLSGIALGLFFLLLSMASFSANFPYIVSNLINKELNAIESNSDDSNMDSRPSL
ncbi:Uncharacterised protein [BD1-7 clade bacterium]|uniref:Uncharacterized protein n=1 Tax=BD1-7 clade bacterium TaxID=2029982 RepID=A0A5S9PJ55_9GAMM|nr:Uncharacterised protein [BD1-7 clade bacterium]